MDTKPMNQSMNQNSKPADKVVPTPEKSPAGSGGCSTTGQDSCGGATACTNPHEGKLVRVSGNTLVMTNNEGQEHSHTMAPDAKVLCDGAACRVQDLKPGSKIRVTTEPNDLRVATKVESLNKQADFVHSA